MIKPILDNVLIEPQEAEKQTAGGILLPEGAKEAPQIGRLLAVGPEVKTIKTHKNSKYNEEVIYKKWMGTEIKYEGKKYILIAEKDVLGIIV